MFFVQVGDIFYRNKHNPPVNKNAAPHSGAVSWVRGLVERVEEPMSKLRNMNKVWFVQHQAKLANTATEIAA